MTNEKTITDKDMGKLENNQIPIREIAPAMDIFADADSIYLEGNMPGVDESSVDISFEKDTLTIVGKNQTVQMDNLTLRYAEYRSGNYRRSFQFQESIDVEAIEAVVKNGILKLKIPIKKPETKKITVKAS